MHVDEGTIRLLNEAYLKMTDQGTDLDPASDAAHEAWAFTKIGIDHLVKLRREHGDGVVYATIAELEPGAQRLLAAQAIAELDDLDFELEIEDDEEDDWPEERE